MPPFTARSASQSKSAPPPTLVSGNVNNNINLGPVSGGRSRAVIGIPEAREFLNVKYKSNIFKRVC